MHFSIIIPNTHINDNINLPVGGIANQLRELLECYKKYNNIRISIITKYSNFDIIPHNMDIYSIHKFKNIYIDSLYFLVKSFLILIAINKRYPISIMNIHHYSNLHLAPLITRILFKIPILMKLPIDFDSYLDEIFYSTNKSRVLNMINLFWFKIFKKIFLKKIDFIRAINNKMYEDLLMLNYPEDHILRIPNGIHIEKFKKLKKKTHLNTNYGFVGRLIEFKNIRLLLNGFKIYFQNYYKNDKLFIFGKGSEEDFIRKFVRKNNLEKNIIICGFVKDKNQIYSKIDVLVDPALAQGLSNAILEAILSNTFVIAANGFGNKDIIKDNKTGLLFDPRDHYDLLDKLLFYRNSRDKEIIIENARNDLLKNYNINNVAESIIAFLQKNLSTNK